MKSEKVKDNFSYRLKLFRDKKKINQTELAKLLGISKSMVSAYEKGTRMPSWETMVGLADIFGVPIGIFFTDTEVKEEIRNEIRQVRATNYYEYQLQWMIDHGYSLKDLMDGLSEQIGYGFDMNECFSDWCEYRGFRGGIWACEEEWKDCEGGDNNETN